MLAAPVKLYRNVKITQHGYSYRFFFCCHKLTCFLFQKLQKNSCIFMSHEWIGLNHLVTAKGTAYKSNIPPRNQVPHFRCATVTSILREKTPGDSPSSGSVTHRKVTASTWQSSSATRRVHTVLPRNSWLLLNTSIPSSHCNLLYLTRVQQWSFQFCM